MSDSFINIISDDNNNLEEINLIYEDYIIHISHSHDFYKNIEKGFEISIEHNFDIYKSYITYEDILNYNKNINTKYLKYLNSNLILKNINNKSFSINIKSDYIEFIINIIEYNINIYLIVKKNNSNIYSFDYKDYKIKKLENKILEIEENYNILKDKIKLLELQVSELNRDIDLTIENNNIFQNKINKLLKL